MSLIIILFHLGARFFNCQKVRADFPPIKKWHNKLSQCLKLQTMHQRLDGELHILVVLREFQCTPNHNELPDMPLIIFISMAIKACYKTVNLQGPFKIPMYICTIYGLHHILKLSPQPQVPFILGLLNMNSVASLVSI